MSIDIIGINNFLNLILVNEYIKPAFLLPENNEVTARENVLSEITKAFPHLKQSINYKIYDGIIISYNDYNDYNGDTVLLQNIGLLLGYPFYENFNNINDIYNTCTIKINVKLKNGVTEHLFSNICHHLTEYIIESINMFVETANDAFNKENYINMLGDFAVIDVYTEILTNTSPEFIIQKLINNIKLDTCDFNTIQDFLIELNFSHKFQSFFKNHFQYQNKIHKGLLIGILINSKHSLLTPFEKLHNYTEKYNDIRKIIIAWETELTNIIRQTLSN